MKTALYETQKKLGAEFYDFHGWELARRFPGAWKRGLLDLTFTRVFRMDGGQELLQGQATNDFSDLESGHGKPTAFTDRFGKVLALANIYHLNGSYYIWCYPSCFQYLYSSLGHLGKFRDAAKVVDEGLHVIGLFDREDPQGLGTIREEKGFIMAKHDRLSLKLVFTTTPVETYRLFLNDHQPMGFVDFDMERIRAGELIYGVDINESYVFTEAALPDHVSFTKGCFVGQEVVARLHNFKGAPPIAPKIIKGYHGPGDKLIIEGREATVTSSSGGWMIASVRKEPSKA